MLKVIVDRKRWWRGGGPSRLRDSSSEMMCCVGFACLAAGMEEEKIVGKRVVHSKDFSDIPEELYGLVYDGKVSPSATELYRVNDNRDYSKRLRETLVKEIGQRVGLEFEFVG